MATVFAGADIEATDRAREYFAPYPPSSPSVALLRDGKLVWMMQRRDIETRDAQRDRAAADRGVRSVLRRQRRFRLKPAATIF